MKKAGEKARESLRGNKKTGYKTAEREGTKSQLQKLISAKTESLEKKGMGDLRREGAVTARVHPRECKETLLTKQPNIKHQSFDAWLFCISATLQRGGKFTRTKTGKVGSL